jgi:S-DNA-T family DNA segregation ATPase FtsK/SpoIIIE
MRSVPVPPVPPAVVAVVTPDGGDGPGAEVVPIRPGSQVEPAEPAEPPAAEPPVIYADITSAAGERRPVIPVPWQRENLRGTIEQLAGLTWHRTKYHGLRILFYAVAVLFWAAAGVARTVKRQVAWWWLLEQHSLRSEAAAAGDSREWMKLHREAKQDRKIRGGILALELTGILIAISILARIGLWQVWAGVATVAVPILAVAGRPYGHRIISPAVVPPQYEEPTHDSITEALGSLGIKRINDVIKEGRGLSFITPVMRDGPGWGVQLDLPKGVTAGHIIQSRPELASGLRRPLSATWPEGVPAEHEGRLSLWVGFHDITKTKQPRWPLAKAGTSNVFEGVPFGTDPRMRPVTVPLFEVNWLIGAAPGQGKTAAVRVLACGAALDPLADVWVHEQAGKGDLEPFAQISHRYCSGLDDDAIAYSAESFRLLKVEGEKRSKVFGPLPREMKRDGKITRELAARGFRPIVAFFDEVQNVFMHPEHGAQAAEDAAYVIRVFRALGIIIVLSTQRPDKDSLPTAVSGIVTARFCLKVPDYASNDMILGTGAYKAGYKATLFRAKTDAGLGWLKGDGDPQILRTYYHDLPATEKIAARARLLRERAGVLSGYALGLDDEVAAPRDVLADLLAVFDGSPGMHWGVAADRLAERFPDRWADLTGETLSAQCRSLGVKSVDVRIEGIALKGCRKVAVAQAAGQL